MNKNFGFSMLLVASISAGILSCGGDSGSTTTTNGTSDTGQSYFGPGSTWNINLAADSTFTITYAATIGADVSLTVTGTYERLASGYLHLTVADSEGVDGPSAGDEAWALEAPGYAMLLKPMDASSDQIIPMLASGSCPSGDFSANWVIVKKANASDATDSGRDWFGSFQWTQQTSTATLPTKYALDNAFTAVTEGGGAMTGTCSEGIMTIDENNDMTADAAMYLTSNGGAIVHTSLTSPSDASFIFGLTQKEISSVANLQGNYAGILFDENMSDGSKINPVSFVCDANGQCSGALVLDVETGETSTGNDTVTVNLANPDTLGDGLITGTITSDGTGNLACMVDIDVLSSGKKIISCVGQSPGDQTRMFNVLLVSKDN